MMGLLEEAIQQPHQTTVRHLLADSGQQGSVRDRVEVALQIGIDDMRVPGLQEFVHPPQRVLAAPSGAEAVAVLSEVLLEDRFEHHSQGRLNYSVAYGRYPQRTLLLTSRFGNPVPSDRLRPVLARAQLLAQAPQVGVHIIGKPLDRDMVHPGRSLVGGHFLERRPQRRFRIDLVDQAVPLAAFDPLFEGRQHPRRPNRRFDPRPASLDLSVACSPCYGHCRQADSVRSGHRVSIFLHPVAPPALPGFIATMDALTPARGRGLKASSAPLLGAQVSLLHVIDLPNPPSPTTDPLPWPL